MNEIRNYSETQLALIKASWDKAFEKARDAKRQFVENGREVEHYYCEKHTQVYRDYNINGFWKQATINKTYEGVKTFGSYLHQQAPIRRVMGRTFDDPLAEVIEAYEKYTSREMDLRRQGRRGLEEALIYGMGNLYTEIDEYTTLVSSSHRSCDDLLMDADARDMEDCWWIAWRCREPLWKFKRKYGKAADGVRSDIDNDRKEFDLTREKNYLGTTQNMITYYKVFSKMGVGFRASKDADDEIKEQKDRINDYKYIVLAQGLNRPVYIGGWPTPFWADNRSMGWPSSNLFFARKPNELWPLSIFAPALPLQKWIDWAYSFLLRKVATSSRDIIVIPESLNEKQKAVIRGDSMNDFEIMMVNEDAAEDVRKIFATLQFSQMNGDLLTAIGMAEQKFREITGLHEILSGVTDASYRSAEEARVKDRNSRSRVEDMNQEVETWHSHAARKEAIALRYHFGDKPEYIAQILGPEMAEKWSMYAYGDLKSIVREYEYTIEEGSMRRLTPQVRAEQAQMLMDMLLPGMMQAGSFNTVNNIISEWCKSNGVQNPERFFIDTTVIDGMQVTPEQYRQMQMQEQQAAMEQDAAAGQDAQAQDQAAQANAIQAQMVEAKNEAELTKQAMQSQTQLEVADKNMLTQLLSKEQGNAVF